jgi:hypothetical protein
MMVLEKNTAKMECCQTKTARTASATRLILPHQRNVMSAKPPPITILEQSGTRQGARALPSIFSSRSSHKRLLPS